MRTSTPGGKAKSSEENASPVIHMHHFIKSYSVCYMQTFLLVMHLLAVRVQLSTVNAASFQATLEEYLISVNVPNTSELWQIVRLFLSHWSLNIYSGF